MTDLMLDSFVIDLLDFVLRHNYFIFSGAYFRQISGTAMGARCAPSYANLFKGWWEGHTCNPSVVYQEQLVKWVRNVDVIVFLWAGTKEECLNLIA